MSDYVSSLMEWVKAKNRAEDEFHQAVQEVADSLVAVLDKHPEYRTAKILERIIEPERVTVPSLLKAAGYNTGCVGSWHLGMDMPALGSRHLAAPRSTARVRMRQRFNTQLHLMSFRKSDQRSCRVIHRKR